MSPARPRKRVRCRSPPTGYTSHDGSHHRTGPVTFDQATTDEPCRLAVIHLGNIQYAFEARSVQQVLRYVRPQPTGSQAAWMCGVIGVRGSIVPVIDLAVRLGSKSPGRELSEHARIIVFECSETVAGAIIDGVGDLITIPSGQVEQAPPGSASFIAAVARAGERMIEILDADALLRDATVT